MHFRFFGMLAFDSKFLAFLPLIAYKVPHASSLLLHFSIALLQISCGVLPAAPAP